MFLRLALVPDAKTAGWLIVDDESDGVEFGKGWRKMHNANGDQVGDWYHKASDKSSETVEYPLPVKGAGRYTLMGKIPYLWSAKPGAETAFEICSGGRTKEFVADQAQCTGQWVKLGEFDLAPGATLRIVPAKSKGLIVADGFALVP